MYSLVCSHNSKMINYECVTCDEVFMWLLTNTIVVSVCLQSCHVPVK